MSESKKADIRKRKEDFDKEIYRLLLFYNQLTGLLETFFSGYLMIPTVEINRNYLRLCDKIEKILEKPGFEDLVLYDWCPFDNLTSLDPDAPDFEWEYKGRQVCTNFLSAIEKIFISTGEKRYPLDAEDQQLLSYVKTYLDKYRRYKRGYETKWLEGIKTQSELPQFNFEFIRDAEIKSLLIKDWEEAKKASQNGLYKSTVILCGTILESLLIDALSCIEKEAKFNYYQKYIEGKNKGDKPPEIENWQLYRLIEIAKQQYIMGADAAKLSHIVRDYRNLIHLFAQKRNRLQIDVHATTAVVSLLVIAYNNILEWHTKKRG